MKTAQELVLFYLNKSSYTAKELRSLIPLHPETVKSAINKLKHLELLHICGWEFNDGCRQFLPIYADGPGADALHPNERRVLNDNMLLLSKAMFSSNYNPFVRETYALS